MSGTLAGQAITTSNRSIYVIPGSTFGGSVTYQLNSTYAPMVSMAVTPTWGDRTTSFVDVGTLASPVTALTQTVNLYFQAPSTVGTYWIIAVFSNEIGAGSNVFGFAANLLAATSTLVGGPVWNDGNDVIDWSASTIQTANTSGTVQVPYLYSTGMGRKYYAATAIQVNVGMASLPSYTISKVAGGGSPLGVTSLNAELGQPVSVAVDGAGNRFIALQAQNRVVRVNSSGIIDLVIGDEANYSGDGGPASAARLNYPIGLAVDGAGNLFIADFRNACIRKVTAGTGIITTVAGTPTQGGYSGDGGKATAAQFNGPSGIAVDKSGNLFIADQHNNRIRRVDATTGTITTVAGNGTGGFSGDGSAAISASLSGPNAIAVTASGDLLIVDTGNQRIRRVSATTGMISTVAGNGSTGPLVDGGSATATGLSFPSAVAVDALGNFFISDVYNGRIRRVDTNTGNVTTFAGTSNGGSTLGDGGSATSARLYNPQGLVFDTAGNLFVADQMHSRIRKIAAGTLFISTTDGGGSTAEGTSAAQAILESPSGVAVDASGNVFLSDTNHERVRRVDAKTGNIMTVAGNGNAGFSGDNGAATSASLNSPRHLALDGSGNLFIADSGNNRIRKVAAGTGTITTVAGNGVATFAGDGGLATAASLNGAWGVALDSGGNLYIADTNNHRIRKVATATGNIVTVAGNGQANFNGDGGPATSGSISAPQGLALDATGNLFIADTGNNLVRRVDAGTGSITTAAGTGGSAFSGDIGTATAISMSSPTDIAVDLAGNLLISDFWFRKIRRVDVATGIITTIAGSLSFANGRPDGDGASTPALTPLWAPTAVYVAPSSQIYISEAFSNRLRDISPIPQYSLSINKSGSGSGTVTSSGFSISCGATCGLTLPVGATVQFTAIPDSNSIFSGWAAACAGTSTCNITMSAATSITANFTANASVKAAMITPAPGSVFPGATTAFTWTPGTLVTQYCLQLGSHPGASDLYGPSCNGNLSTSVSALPVDGRPVYARLSSLIAGTSQYSDYSYTAAALSAGDYWIYIDSLRTGWGNLSGADVDFTNSSHTHSGNSSIQVTAPPGKALAVGRLSLPPLYETTLFANLSFWIHGGDTGGQLLAIQAGLNNVWQPPVTLPALTPGQWQLLTFPLNALGLSPAGTLTGFRLSALSNSPQTPFYVDDIKLTAAGPPVSATVAVDLNNVVRVADPRQFGINTTDWDRYLGASTDLALLQELKMQALRFPGGSVADTYHWNSTIAYAPGLPSPDGVTFDTFAKLAASLGAQSIVTVNYGTGTPAEAAQWVQYSNVTRHYNTRYWEVGNENYGSWETDTNARPHDPQTYAVRFAEYFKQMKAVDPTIKIGAVAVVGEDSDANYSDEVVTNPVTGVQHSGWTPVMLATLTRLGVVPDFLSYHRYDPFAPDFELLQSAYKWQGLAADLRGQLNDYLGSQANAVELLCTEHNSSAGVVLSKQMTNLVNGLFLADSVANAIQTEFSALLWWDLHDNMPQAVTTDDGSIYGWRLYADGGITNPVNLTDRYPTFYATKLLQKFARGGDRIVSATSNYPLLDAFAANRTDGSLSLLVVNKSSAYTIPARINLSGFTPSATAVLDSYGILQDEAARTGVGSPDIAQTTFSGASDSFNYSFPPYSITVISLSPLPARVPAITSVNVAGGGADIAPNSWIEIKGSGLAPVSVGSSGITWSSAPEFASGKMPTQLDGVNVTVNGKRAYVYYVSAAQVNVLTPLDSTTGTVMVQLTNGTNISTPFPVNIKSAAPAFLLFGATNYIAATHADGSLLGPASMSVPGYTFTPAKPNETIVLYGAGFGLPAGTLTEGSSSQFSALATPPAIRIGGNSAAVTFAGLVSPGLYQFNVVVPAGAGAGDNAATATYLGGSPLPSTLISIQVP